MRNKMMALHFATQVQEMKAIGGQPDYALAHERIYQHSLKLEDARAQAAYGQHSSVGKDTGDPPGTARPHPYRPHPAAGRLLNRPPRARLAAGQVRGQARGGPR
jgi:hypothetical protein